jgi:carboxypeptidase T
MKIKLFFVFILIHTLLLAQTEKYSRVKILLNAGTKSISELQKLGLEVDHGDYRSNESFTSDFSFDEIALIKKAGFETEILIDDVQKFYAEQNNHSHQNKSTSSTIASCFPKNYVAPIKPQNFHLGAYAGYFKYQEMLDIIDSMHLLYPNLISVKQAIDTFQTIEGRPIYWVRVSNNPSVLQANKPQMLYTAVHHAREPASMSQLIYYLWYLLENYNTNPQIQAIINNTELYFIPCINPDGYIFNETTNPNGGGMWRKNRRDNLDGTFGVDLNRNYGYNWGFDNIGSSNTSSSNTYRGTNGFSEPETQALQWFSENHQFKINLNYHSFSNVLIYPWGYIGSLRTNDSLAYETFGQFISEDNGYKQGTCNEVLGYITNGSSDDWQYGEQTSKNKTFAFTPEVGPSSTGFYPPSSDILGLCEANLYANINAAKLILQHAVISRDKQVTSTQLNSHLKFDLKRIGLKNSATYTVSIVPLDVWISSAGTPKTYTNINFLQLIRDSINYTLNPSISNGQAYRFLLKMNNGIYDEIDTVQAIYNNTVSLPISTNSLVGWSSVGGTWNVSNTNFYSAPNSMTDSPLGNYSSFAFNKLTLNTDIDLTNAIKPTLSFYCKWDIEKNNDYAVVEISSDQGATWTPLCGKYTVEGGFNQLQGSPIYDGTSNNIWLKEEMPLDNYVFLSVRFRFTLGANFSNNKDGFYFDDLMVNGLDNSVLGNKDPNKNKNSAQLSLYPNPSNESVNIFVSTNKDEMVELNIRNATLQVVEKILIKTNQSNKIDTRKYDAGIYYCTILYGSGEKQITKLVITK